MPPAPLPADEALRLETLRRYRILDTEFEEAYDDLCALASQLCGTPIALISFLDEHRQWFKAVQGLSLRETQRDVAFCAYTILDKQPFEVVDALKDPRFADNPLVLQAPSLRSYLGVPLLSPEGRALGTLCVLDRKPRQLTADQIQGLERLARQILRLLDLHLANRRLEEDKAQRQRFFEVLAHDLRSPFNGLLGLTEYLNDFWDEVSSEEGHSLIGELNLSARSTYRHLNDLLSGLLAEAGQAADPPEELNLRALLGQVVEEHHLLIERKDLTILWEGPAEVRVWAERRPLFSIALNLFVNSVKFSPLGSSLTIRVDPAGAFTLADQGGGLSAKGEQRLVEGLGAGTEATGPQTGPSEEGTSGERGKGLGLWLCRNFGQRLGGRFTVQSRPGEGTEITFTLPQTR